MSTTENQEPKHATFRLTGTRLKVLEGVYRAIPWLRGNITKTIDVALDHLNRSWWINDLDGREYKAHLEDYWQRYPELRDDLEMTVKQLIRDSSSSATPTLKVSELAIETATDFAPNNESDPFFDLLDG